MPTVTLTLAEATPGCRWNVLLRYLGDAARVTNRPRRWQGGPVGVDAWNEAILDLAREALERMPRPRLPMREVRRLAYLVSTWFASGGRRDHSPETQRWRGRRGGRPRLYEPGAEPWTLLGVSRATWYRQRAVRQSLYVRGISGVFGDPAAPDAGGAAALDDALVRLASTMAPASVRQLFYAATTEGIIAKTETAYQRVVNRLKDLRLSGRVPWSQIADRTRWQRKPRTFHGIAVAIAHTRRTYRRAVWFDLPVRVFVVLEKDALAGVVGEVTEEYDVSLLVTRGFSSLSFVHSLGEDVTFYAERGVEVVVHALGDLDPSGMLAHEAFEGRLTEWCPADSFRFERLAVTRREVDDWALPTRPTKASTHTAGWAGGASVELDAIPPDRLRALVRDAIEQHVPEGTCWRSKRRKSRNGKC